MASWAAVAKTTAAAPAPAEAPPPSDTERIAIVDTNAIISGLRLENLADRFCTISEVLTEVRDQQSRTYLSTLPYQLQVIEPTEESAKAVQRFARETGDIHSLSAVDLKLLALAHTLEVAAHGTENIREHPVQVRTRQRHKTRPRALPGWGNVANPEDWKVVDEAPEHLLTNAANAGQSRILAAQPLDLMGGDQPGAAPPQPPAPGQDAAPQAAAPAAGGELPALPLPQPATPPAASGQQQEQGQGQGQQAEAGTGLQGPGDGGARGQGQGHAGDQGDDDSGDEEEEEDDGGWETAAKSRNAARRKQRRERRRQDWLQRQAQGTGAGAGASGPAHATVTVAAGAGASGAQAQPAAAGAGLRDDGEHGDGEQEEEQEEGESGDVEQSGEGDEDGEEVLELVTDEEEGEGEQGTDCGASEAGTTTATATGTIITQGGEEAEVLPNTTSRVFSVTADFAMQNVMLQMGLRLVTRDGKQITRVSRWALRCSACYFVTKEAGRLFCPRCGNMTMDRVEVTVGPGGAEFFGVRKKFILRGTKYSLPKPKSGRQAIKNPILREDVLMARTAGRQRKAKPAAAEGGEVDPFAPEYGKETWHASGGGRTGGRGLNIPLTNWKNNPNEVKTQRKNRRR